MMRGQNALQGSWCADRRGRRCLHILEPAVRGRARHSSTLSGADRLVTRHIHRRGGEAAPRAVEAAVRENTYRQTEGSGTSASDATGMSVSLPANKLLTAFEVADLVGCHEESVRRAYLCGQLKRQRFGVRSWRFRPADVEDWIRRGAPTRIS
jgi:excisionase family DNA binding protein